MLNRAKWLGYCGVELMSVWVNIRSGYCPVGCMSSRVIVYRISVSRLLSGQVTVWSCYSPVGLLPGPVTVCWVSVHRATVCQGCVLGEVSVRLVSDWASVQKSFGIYLYLKLKILFRKWHSSRELNLRIRYYLCVLCL